MAWNGKFENGMRKRASKPNHKATIKTDYYGQFKASDVRRGDHPLKLSYHHITDWAKIRDVWNKLIDDRHFSTICIWLYAAGFDTSNNYYETDLPQTPFGITRAILNGTDVQKVADPDEIHARITWSTWNLVEGPEGAIRTGDEGNFHDIFSNCAGLTDDERAALQAADRVYNAMAALNLSGTIQKERALALSKALLGVNRNAQVIKFRESMWTHRDHGPTKCTSNCWTKSIR